MNSMYEVQPWPGVLFRIASNQNFEVDMNGGSKSFKKNFEKNTTNKVVIKRKSGVIYVIINDGDPITAADHSSITTFDIPVIFGASMQADQTPQRYYKGTLQNMKVILYE